MTINQLKRLVTLSLFCISISFLVFNCEKEDDIFTTEQQTTATKNYIAPHIVYSDEITSNPKLTQTLQHFKQLNCKPKTKASTTLGNKLVYNEALNITIDDKSAMYLENADGSYHSYTFQAIDHEHPYGVQNIVLSLMPNGTYREVLVRYEVEGNEEIAFRNGESIDLTNKVSYAVLENGSFSSSVLSKVTTMDQCITITADQAGKVCVGSDHHTWEQRNICPHYPGPNGPTPSVPFTVNVDYTCIDALVIEGSSEPAPSGSVPTQANNGSVTTAPYVSPAELERRATFNSQIDSEMSTWFLEQSDSTKNIIYNFLENSLGEIINLNQMYNPEDVLLANEMISFLFEELSSEEALVSTRITSELAVNDIMLGFFTPAFEQAYINNLPPNHGILGILLKYQEHVMREVITIMMTEYEDGHVFTKFEILKIVLKANKEAFHTGLDIAGMAPGVGIIFDVTNATFYAVEMDWTNATLSLGGAIPIAGIWVTGAKLAKKVVYLSNGKKVYLKVYQVLDGYVKFSYRGQLRKVLGITNSANHAHHIIPYSIANEAQAELTKAGRLVQAAAMSNNVWHVNDVYNGIEMSKDLHLLGHSNYTNAVKNKMAEIYDNLSDPNDFDEAYNALQQFCTALKNEMSIFSNSNSGYFVNFINQYTP